MIATSELRIGNKYINQFGNIATVDAIQQDETAAFLKEDVKFIISSIDHEDDCNPIELTPEILEKCEFENNRIFKETITIEVDLGYQTEFGYAVFIEQYSDGVTVRIIIPGWIKYLHQLQNLYYYLTGDELNIIQI